MLPVRNMETKIAEDVHVACASKKKNKLRHSNLSIKKEKKLMPSDKKCPCSHKYTCPFKIALEIANSQCVLDALRPSCSDQEKCDQVTCLKRLAKHFHLDRIDVLNTQGIEVASTNCVAVGFDFSQRPNVQTTLQGEAVQTAFKSAVDGVNYVVTTSAVLTKGNAILGMVATFVQI